MLKQSFINEITFTLTIGQVVDCIESTFRNLNYSNLNFNMIYLQNLVILWHFSLNCSKKEKVVTTIPMRESSTKTDT